jgi:hypothetical protein
MFSFFRKREKFPRFNPLSLQDHGAIRDQRTLPGLFGEKADGARFDRNTVSAYLLAHK